jgi:hypothetical protein
MHILGRKAKTREQLLEHSEDHCTEQASWQEPWPWRRIQATPAYVGERKLGTNYPDLCLYFLSAP